MRRVGIVAVILLLMVTVIPGNATGAEARPDEICAGITGQNVLVATIPTHPDQAVFTDSGDSGPALYPGTTLSVMLCSNGHPERVGTAWELPEPPGLSIPEDGYREEMIEATVTGTVERIEITEVQHKQQISGLSIDIVSSPTVDSRFADGSIRFSSDQQARAYRTLEEDMQSNAAALDDHQTRLDEATEALRSGESGPLPVEANLWNNLLDTSETLRQQSAQTREMVLNSGDYAAFAAADRIEQREAGSLQRTKKSLEAYRDALGAEIRELRMAAWMNFAIFGVLPGAVTGALVGLWNPRRKAAGESYDRKYRAIEYEWTVLWPSLLLFTITAIAFAVIVAIFVPGLPDALVGWLA